MSYLTEACYYSQVATSFLNKMLGLVLNFYHHNCPKIKHPSYLLHCFIFSLCILSESDLFFFFVIFCAKEFSKQLRLFFLAGEMEKIIILSKGWLLRNLKSRFWVFTFVTMSTTSKIFLMFELNLNAFFFIDGFKCTKFWESMLFKIKDVIREVTGLMT